MRRHLATTSVTITDPYVKYQSLVSQGIYLPDQGQRRLALHLRKLYGRLKDYTPAPHYRDRLRRVAAALEDVRAAPAGQKDELAVPGHPIRRNPLFAKFFRASEGRDGGGGGGDRDSRRDSLELTRVLTSHQAALEADSPKGLFLSGDVGTGKSMLLDLLAEGLPTRGKRRWHFNTFMLHAFSRLEEFRRRHQQQQGSMRDRGDTDSTGDMSLEYSLLWMAREMVEASPILFLDEFQLPDRAASKLLSNLFVAFFQLGGVLVASSNRVPEELERAAGASYSPPVKGGLLRGRLFGGRVKKGELYGGTSDFAVFLEVLKARCDFFHIEGRRDWRRRTDSGSGPILLSEGYAPSLSDALSPLIEGSPGDGVGRDVSGTRPSKYLLHVGDSQAWTDTIAEAVQRSSPSTTVIWEPASLVVYGRKVVIPRHHRGVTLWEFGELVSSFGPADYITLASNFHTFIIDGVPILPTSRKNEARRFITLLDALYEARCKLIIRAEAGPDDLFFPETRNSGEKKSDLNSPSMLNPSTSGDPASSATRATAQTRSNATVEENAEDATYSETISDVYQDQTSPFRPNVSTYSSDYNYDDDLDRGHDGNGTRSRRGASTYDPDQDSDFGASGTESGEARWRRRRRRGKVDFADVGAFTGEDERFAYRRAASRLWELCGGRWHAREGDGWWVPLPREARHWEGTEPSTPMSPTAHLERSKGLSGSGDATMGPSEPLDEPAGLARFRVEALRKAASSDG